MASSASRPDSVDTQLLHRPLSQPWTDVGYCKWKDPSGEPFRGTPNSGRPLGPVPNFPAPGLADAACSGGCQPVPGAEVDWPGGAELGAVASSEAGWA